MGRSNPVGRPSRKVRTRISSRWGHWDQSDELKQKDAPVWSASPTSTSPTSLNLPSLLNPIFSSSPANLSGRSSSWPMRSLGMPPLDFLTASLYVDQAWGSSTRRPPGRRTRKSLAKKTIRPASRWWRWIHFDRLSLGVGRTGSAARRGRVGRQSRPSSNRSPEPRRDQGSRKR